MPTPLETVKEFLPEISLAGSVSLFAWFIIFVVVAIAAGFGVFLLLRMMKFNKKIIIFEKIGKNFEPTRNDRAMEVKVGDAGDTIFYLRKHKKYLPTPSIQTGRRTYWYFIRSDQEWINIGIEDLDHKMRLMKASFLDKEMRHVRVALHRNLKDRFQKLNFWAVYGGVVAYVGLIAVTGIMIYLSFDKFIDIIAASEAAVKASERVLDSTRDILVALDNVKGGGGIRPA